MLLLQRHFDRFRRFGDRVSTVVGDAAEADSVRPSTAPGSSGHWVGLAVAIAIFLVTVWVYSQH